MEKDANVHKINGFRQKKKLNRLDRLEVSVSQIGSIPQFMMQKLQEINKVVEDLRFTYEIIGTILVEKGIISQEEVNAVGKRLIDERREARNETIENTKLEAEKRTDREKINIKAEVITNTVNNLKEDDSNIELIEEIASKLMQSREDLQDSQSQDKDVSFKLK